MSNEKLDLILNELKQMNGRMSTMEERMENVEYKLDATIGHVVQNSEDMSVIRANVKKILEDQKSIHEILGEHEVSIRTIRRKPV